MSSPFPSWDFQDKTMERQLLQLSLGGYWTAPQLPHVCNAKRPSAAAAVSPRAIRLRADGGRVGNRVLSTGFFLLGRSNFSFMKHPKSRLPTPSRDRN